jgi:hypothetical protein
MKAFDYLSSLILLFTAITLGELTMGLAYALNSGTRASFFLPHTFLVIATFSGSVDYALRVYTFRKVSEWQFWSLLMVLIPGLAYLLGTKMLFPDIDPPTRYDFEEVFLSNKSLIYLMICIYIVTVNAAFAVVYGIKYKMKVLAYGILLVAFISGIIFDNLILDYFITSLALFGNLVNSFWLKIKIKNED